MTIFNCTLGGENADIGLIDIRSMIRTENGAVKTPKSIKFIGFTSSTCTSVDLIIGELIDIQ